MASPPALWTTWYAPWAWRATGHCTAGRRQVSQLCAEIGERIRDFLGRPIEGDWPYLWLDATYMKVRDAGRIVSVAITIAVGVNADGRREVLGMAVGISEEEPFWLDLLRDLARRGLRGVQSVISNAHEGFNRLIKSLHLSANLSLHPHHGFCGIEAVAGCCRTSRAPRRLSWIAAVASPCSVRSRCKPPARCRSIMRRR